MSEMPTPRFVIRTTDTTWTASIQNAQQLADAITPELFAAFLKCFRGADQLVALEHLIILSQPQFPDRSVASDRNGTMLVFMLLSTMREMGKALQELCHARVVEKINDRSKWMPLNELRDQWYNDATINKYRNQLGFHLGHASKYQDGLAKKLETGDELEFAHGDGSKRHHGSFTLASDVLLSGLAIEDDEVELVIGKTREAHKKTPDLLFELWQEVLDTAGIETAHID